MLITEFILRVSTTKAGAANIQQFETNLQIEEERKTKHSNSIVDKAI